MTIIFTRVGTPSRSRTPQNNKEVTKAFHFETEHNLWRPCSSRGRIICQSARWKKINIRGLKLYKGPEAYLYLPAALKPAGLPRIRHPHTHSSGFTSHTPSHTHKAMDTTMQVEVPAAATPVPAPMYACATALTNLAGATTKEVQLEPAEVLAAYAPITLLQHWAGVEVADAPAAASLPKLDELRVGHVLSLLAEL